jgi:hypothetical protein
MVLKSIAEFESPMGDGFFWGVVYIYVTEMCERSLNPLPPYQYLDIKPIQLGIKETYLDIKTVCGGGAYYGLAG